MTSTSGRQEFTVRGLLALTKQINDDPSLVESDWRAPFRAAFDMSASQNQLVDEIAADRYDRMQALFRLAAAQSRRGHRMKLRIVSDITNDSRRTLQLEIPPEGLMAADRVIIDETGSTDASLTFPIVCCCADCCCWHWCDPGVNPCGPH